MADILSPTGIEKPIGGEQHSRAMINRNYDRTNAIAIDAATLAKGLKHINKGLANSGAITGISVVYNIPSFTFLAGRKYQIEWDSEYIHSVANTYHRMEINTCSTADSAALTTGLTVIQSNSFSAKTAGFNESFYVRAVYEPVADTTVQIKFTAKQTAGTGTCTIIGSAATPNKFTITDLGDQI